MPEQTHPNEEESPNAWDVVDLFLYAARLMDERNAAIARAETAERERDAAREALLARESEATHA